MEQVTGIEPVFPAWEASVITDIRYLQNGARDGNRTRIRNLEGSGNSHYTTRAGVRLKSTNLLQICQKSIRYLLARGLLRGEIERSKKAYACDKCPRPSHRSNF